MDNLDNKEELIKRHHNGKRWAGLIVVIVGAVLLSRQMGFYFPDWLFSWPMLLIVGGLFIGAKHQFRRPGWVIMCIIGGVFLMDEFIPGFTISDYFWPVLIIGAGLLMIFGKRRDWGHDWKNKDWHEKWHKDRHLINMDETTVDPLSNSEDFFESTAIFGGIKKNIISKDFKGGEVVCIFSGAEINLSQAEIKRPVALEITNIFGGTKLIIPAHWKIRSEMVAILGGIEDKRMQMAPVTDDNNTLIIRGTTVLGGIEIKSF